MYIMKRLTFMMMLLLMILTACEVNNGPVAGVINGRSVSYSEYMNAFRTEYENFYTVEGRAPNTDEKREIGKLTWLYKTKYVILQDYYKRYDIKVSHQEVIDTLTQNPPAYIVNSPRFKSDDKFDREIYLQSLNYDSPQNLKPVRKKYFDDIIPIGKLKEALIDKEFLDKKTSRQVAQVIGSKADIDWVIFDSAKADIKINDTILEDYYQGHLDNYKQEPYFSLRYTLIPVSPSEDDINNAKAVTDSIYSDLVSGVSLEDIAASSRTAYHHIKFNSTGFLFVPDLSPELKQAIYNQQPGAVLAPIMTNEGYEIYRLDVLTKSMVKLSRLLIPTTPGEKSIASAEKKAQDLVELAKLLSMDQACLEMDYTLCREDKILPGTPITEDETLDLQIYKKLEKSSKGTIITPIFSYPLSAWIVVMLSDKQTQNHKALEDIKDIVKADLISEKKAEFTRQKASVWLASYDLPAPLESTTEYSVYTLKSQTMNDPLMGMSVKDVYYKALTAQLQKKPASVYEYQGLYLIPIVRHAEFPAKPTTDQALIRQIYVRNLAPDWFDTWMNEKIKTAKTKLNTLGQ